MRPHRLLISCAAAGALALGPSAAALAAGHSPHGGGSGHGTTHGQHHANGHSTTGHGKAHSTHDRLAGPRNAAGHVLKAQTARLARMLAAVAAGDTLTDDDQAALLGALQADREALLTDLGAIQEASNVHQLNAVKHAAVLTVTIAVQQVGVVIAADALKQQADELAGTLSDLAVQVAMAADMGHPVGAAAAAVEDAQGQVGAAAAAAQNAINTILGVSPTGSRGELNDATDAASQDLLDAQNALAAAAVDIAEATAALAD